MDVSFNGTTKIIKVNNGITSISVKDVYSWWKQWVASGNEAFLSAFRYVGGDPTISGQYLGTTYFLTNGWLIEPYNGNHVLVVDGNLFSDDYSSPFNQPSGDYKILIQNQFSNLTTTVETGGSSLTTSAIAKEVWNTNIETTPFSTSGSIGEYVKNKVLTIKKFLALS